MPFGLLVFFLFLVPVACPASTAFSDLNGEPVWITRSETFGEIRVRSIYLEAPDHLLALINKPTSRPRWAFVGGTEVSVRELLTRAGLPADLLARLMDPSRRVLQEGAFVVFPEVADLLALTPAMRAVLYPELAKSPLNEFHRDPVFIVGETLDDWLRQSRLGDRQKAAFRRMVWRRGDILVFSDIRTLLTLAESPSETQEVFRAMSRTRALVVDLALPGNADLAALLGYWSAGFPDADTLPFLRGALQRDSVTSVDVSRLLPPMARRRLYTYPTLDQAIGGRFPDCHWTSLNFFNNAPVGYYLDTRLAASALLANYEPVEGPRRFGDLLIYVTGDRVLHSCVFVADDIVFTKNGENILAPWVLQRLSDVSAIYRSTPDIQVRVLRLKAVERLRQR